MIDDRVSNTYSPFNILSGIYTCSSSRRLTEEQLLVQDRGDAEAEFQKYLDDGLVGDTTPDEEGEADEFNLIGFWEVRLYAFLV